MTARIPVFMVHWNRPAECARSVESFLAQDIPCEIQVLDNASRADLRRQLLDRLPKDERVHATFNESNLGYAGALSAALRNWTQQSEAPACVFCADDVLAKPDAVRLLLDAFHHHPDLGLAYPRNLYAQRGNWDWLRGPRLEHIPDPLLPSNGLLRSTWFPEHCVAVRRDLFLRGVQVDKRLYMYYEGLDLGLQASKLGWSSGLIGRAYVENSAWGGSVRGTRLAAYLQARASVHLSFKHAGPGAGILRVLYIVLAGAKNSATGSGRSWNFHSAGRIRGALDGLRKRYGPPAEDLYEKQGPDLPQEEAPRRPA